MSAPNFVSGLKILLVEDDPSVREAIRFLLRNDGHKVTEAANGREAYLLFTGASYDLVITDYLMPEMMGDEFTRQIRNIAPEQRVLMMTGYDERLAAKGTAADGLVGKPVGLESLRQAIQALVTQATST